MLSQGTTTSLSVFTDPATGGRTINPANAEVIYHPDTPADHVYYINRGQVRQYTVGPDESSRLIEIMGPGQWFGSAALAGAATHQSRAVAVAGAVLTEVPVEQLWVALSNHPDQFVELTRQLARKLLAAHEEAARLIFEDCNQRLINALLRFSRSAASTPREDGVVLRITHDQLARAVGVARETVSLALTQLRQQNLLRTGRNQLTFNPEVLEQFGRRQRANGVSSEVVVLPVENAA